MALLTVSVRGGGGAARCRSSFLLIEAQGAGISDVASLVFRPLTGTLLWTVRLIVVVTLACAVIGTAAALVRRADRPAGSPGVGAVLVVVPCAIPDFVKASFELELAVDLGPAGVSAALIIVMTLAVYPLVYLHRWRPACGAPIPAGRRSRWPRLKPRVQGPSSGSPSARPRSAILGGCLLVALVLLAEYGAFEILGYQTFTTEIFSRFHSYGFTVSCALALVLVLFQSGGAGRRGPAPWPPGRVARSGPMVQRISLPLRLGWTRWPVLALFAALVLLALGVPIASTICTWMADGQPLVAGRPGPTFPCSTPLATRRCTAGRRRYWLYRHGVPGGDAGHPGMAAECGTSLSAAPTWSSACPAW